MMARQAFVAGVFSAFVWAAPAQAGCADVAIVAPGDVVLNYEPFDELRETLDVELLVQGRSDTRCQLALSVQSLVPGVYREMRGPQQGIRYELRVGGNLLQNDPASVVPSVTLMPGELRRGAKIRLRFELPPGMLVPAGQYLDTLTVRAFDTSGGEPVPLRNETNFTARLVVPAGVRMLMDGNFSRSGGPFGANVMDLGDLSDGVERFAFLQVRATSDVQLSVSSSNNGFLKNSAVPGVNGTIAYSVNLDGQAVDLRQGAARVSRRIPGNAGRQNVRVLVSVPPVRNRSAGKYRDVLTITAEPN